MKTKRALNLTSLAALVATLTICAASRTGSMAVSAAPATRVQTWGTPETEYEFGGISIGRGQTASIIAILSPSRNVQEQQPVQVEFMFHDWEGNLLAGETRTLIPGQASSFEIGTGLSKKRDLLPCVKVLVDATDPDPHRITATLQVTDTATGKTQIALEMRKSGGDPATAGKPF